MLSSRKAYVLGYVWGLMSKALGKDYDRTGFKFSQGAMRPWDAFTAANDALLREHKLTHELKMKIAAALSEIDPKDVQDRQVLSGERRLQWQLGAYLAESGAPLGPPPDIFDIAEKRKGKGLTQVQLAELMGVDQGVISRWESGKVQPNAENLAKLKELLS